MRRLSALALAAALLVCGGLLATGLTTAEGAAVATSTSTTTSTCPADNPPNDLVLVSGSPQTARIGMSFGSPFQVAVVDRHGCPLTGSLSGISVTFTAPSSGASGTFAGSGSNAVTVGTDANGVATAPGFVADLTEGDYSVRATSTYGSVSFDLHNTASGVASSVGATGTTDQSATVNRQYASALQARVLDVHGAAVSGVTVTFAIATGPSGAGASFLGGGPQATATTDASGVATSPPFVANGTPGRFTASASVSGISNVATYSLDNHAAVYTLKAPAATSQSASVYGRYAQPLRVQVLDDTGQPTEGATVTFALGAGSSGAGASFVGGGAQATALTDASGTATSPAFVANGTAGGFSATASVPGGTSPMTFPLHNVAARLTPARATLTGTVEQRYRERLRARLVGADGKPLDGVTVTFVLGKPSDGAGATFVDASTQATATTNAAGWATSPALVAGTTTGRFTATATASGASPLTYALRIVAGAPAAIAVGAAAGQSTPVGTAFPIRLAVTVTDEKGNAVAGTVVVFRAPTRGPSGLFRGTRAPSRIVRVRTNAKGIAIAPRFVANDRRGGYVVTVSAGRQRAAFALVNTAP